MAEIKEKDFVELEYTGKLKDNNEVFDTTDEKIAKETEIHKEKMIYGPVTVCIGQGQLLKGLEDELIGKEVGKDYSIELAPEKAFGKKDAKLIKTVPKTVFSRNKINPEPGLPVTIDGEYAIIKMVSGGRCIVDFNNPLSGKEVIYNIKPLRIVTDDLEKLKSFLSLTLKIDNPEVTLKEGKAEFKFKTELPKEVTDLMTTKIKELIPGIKEFNIIKK